ncbi:MAG: ribonuclease D [Brevefilum sp.]
MVTKLENTELVWVDQPQKLLEVTDELAAQDILAVDTESNSLYVYQEQVCLIQFSTREKDILIDALALPDLSSLGPIFSSDKILKVFHAAEYDLICLFRDYGFKFNFLFDTMIAARTLGYQKIGYGSLLEQHFDIHMKKKYQRANWGQRPLKQEMLKYARLDSHYLIPLQAILRRELEGSGRWELALEDFRRLTQNIEDTTETTEKDYWKLRGARDLNPREAAILKSVYQFRESKAKEKNRPSFKIMSHQAVVEIAENAPRNREELLSLSALSSRLAKRYAKGLVEAVQEGKKAPPEYPPHHERPSKDVLDRIDALREWRKLTGRDLNVPSDVILPRDVLNRIAHANPKNLEQLEIQMQDIPYRFNRFGHEIMRVIHKNQS